MNVAIDIRDLSKQYRIGQVSFETLPESIMNFAKKAFRKARPQAETVWALKDVSLTINHGETVGIIGRNGAGKSTLLKILSKVTYPTSGTFTLNGRVAAMLEVGTGFHTELTGKENIYMCGSIMGMPKREIDQKMEAIIEFSGVRRFIDTPVKRYSSGMRLRLGFAVAAHLDPDVFIVDEVLAVGDAAFQKKCVNAMENLRGGSRTVLFVSHNLAAVENLCRRCIWIDDGRVRMDGESTPVIKAYMESMRGGVGATCDLTSVTARRGNGKIKFSGIEFLTPEGDIQQLIRAGDPVVIRFHYHASDQIVFPSFGINVYTEMGTLVTATGHWLHGISIPLLDPGDGYVDLEIDSLNLLPGEYALSLWLTSGGIVYDNVEHAATLEVETSNIYNSGMVIDNRYGIVYFPQRWNVSGTRGYGKTTDGGVLSSAARAELQEP